MVPLSGVGEMTELTMSAVVVSGSQSYQACLIGRLVCEVRPLTA